MQPSRRTRGTVIVEVLVVSAALGLAAKLAGWKPSLLFKKHPPTEQVTQLQAELAAAQAELERARQAKAAADAAERAHLEEQVRWSQQMTAGASAALARVPVEHRTAEGQLAGDLLARANFGLAAALGQLPPAKQREILEIVEQALSGVQSERDQALAALRAKDDELRVVTSERESIKAQLPVLTAKLEAKDAAARAISAELTVKTTEVNTFAAKADAKEREAGSLGAAINRILLIVAGLVGLWFFAAWILPPILKLMRPGRVKTILRNVSGYAAGGLHFHDARKKLAGLG